MVTTPRVFLALAVTHLMLLATPASAQYEMALSAYSDYAFDGLDVYGWVDGWDDSWGCTHDDYVTSGYLASPTRYIDGSESGFGVMFHFSFDDDDGAWEVGGGISTYCSCILAYTQTQDIYLPFEAKRVPTFVKRIGTPQYTLGPPVPWSYVVNREILDQFGRPIQAVMFVDESYSPNPPSGNCGSGEIDQGDANSNEGGTFGPDIYSLTGSVPNPCSDTSTQSFVITYKGTPYSVLTTYTVTWSYSGLTLQGNNEP